MVGHAHGNRRRKTHTFLQQFLLVSKFLLISCVFLTFKRAADLKQFGLSDVTLVRYAIFIHFLVLDIVFIDVAGNRVE